MFNSSLPGIDVSIRMLDGNIIRGKLTAGLTSSLEAALSKETPFLEFTSADGQRKFIAKGQIAFVEPVEPLKKPQLGEPNKKVTQTAYSILGLKEGCSYEEARAAFHNQAKLYHPDRFTTVELPPEVVSYMNEMFRQINTAFTELRSALQVAA
jgi:DnaJ-domain-containing protein 1